jgi:predicted glycosyltransferase involved in capsule biosynthesis
MHDLSDVTFTIPIKIDQPDRERNLKACVRYLRENFNTNIIVCEMDSDQKAKELLAGYKCKYIFMKTQSPYFHRTMMLNFMAKQANTDIIVNYDCDVILPVSAYVEASELIRSKKAEMVYPYDGNFYDIHPQFVNEVVSKNSIDFIDKSTMCRNLRPESNSVGGAIFWNKTIFNNIGMENENCISWGYEDNERYDRALKLGVKIERTQNGLFHLHHNSSLNSSNGSHPFYTKNQEEWTKIKTMNINELRNYIKNWSWISQ